MEQIILRVNNGLKIKVEKFLNEVNYKGGQKKNLGFFKAVINLFYSNPG